jgi:hypothetical protein
VREAAPRTSSRARSPSLRRIVEELRHDLRRSRDEGPPSRHGRPALLAPPQAPGGAGMEEPLAQEIVAAQVDAGSLRDPTA